MNILVIGANGYTGSHLVQALLAQGHHVRGLVRNVEQGITLEKLGMDLRVGDIHDRASLSGIASECAIVFNLISSCRIEPSEAKTNLSEGAQNIFRNLDRGALQKYIWTSNVSVYGSPKGKQPLTETSPLKPSYTLGKLTVDAEKLARASAPAVAIRVPSIYGPGRDMLAALREGRIRLLNDGENWQSRIHVDDLVQVLMAAMDRAAPESVYLAADDMPTVQREFFREITAAAGAPMPLSLEANAARAFGVFGRAMNALSGERQYQLSESVIGLVTGNYYCVNNRIRDELQVKLKYPTFREGYSEMLSPAQPKKAVP